MAGILFRNWRQTAEFHNPFKGDRLETSEIEVRLDPLTGHQSILSSALSGKTSILFPETDYEYFRERIEATKDRCFMCGGRWRENTPRYPSRLIPEGRIERGEAVLFPNLFPIAAYHAVVKVGESHGRMPDEFSPGLLYDALSVTREFIWRCFEVDPEAARYFTINANFMPPAGASVVHPHFQILGSPFPGTHQRLLLEKSLAYHAANGSCYWTDLAETEKEAGRRWLGEIGPSSWFTAFSPIGVNEVNAVWPRASHFLEWSDEDARAMAEGISRVLRCYHALKFSSFNFSCFSGPLGEAAPEFRCFLRLIDRQNMTRHFRTDDYYVQKLLKDELIIHEPEKLASLIRESQFR